MFKSYHVEYRLDTIGSAVNSANPAGILGADVGNSNCFIPHELYIQVANLYIFVIK
jgi:hypothetical protein